MGWLRHPAARWLGRLASLLALGWLVYEFSRRWNAIDAAMVDMPILSVAALLMLAYGAALLLLALNWRDLVQAVSPVRDDALLLRSFTDTQIAKYLPGNVAHFVGRHLLLAREGVSHKALGKALLMETMLLLAGAGVTAALALLLLPGSFDPLGFSGELLAAVALVGAVMVVIGLWLSGPRAVEPVRARLPVSVLRTILFMGVLGLAFWILLDRLADVPPAAPVAAMLVAWAVGFATPGSPGGIGTREAAALLLLSPVAPTEALLVALALFRLVTIGGDVVCWALPKLLWREKR